MLYDADTSLTQEGQSTRDAEAVLTARMAALRVAPAAARLDDKQRFVHFVADKHLRVPHLTVRFGKQLIQNAAGKLGDAVWDLYERVLLASLDAHDSATTRWALEALTARWPGSARVQRLQAQAAEARGHFAEADDAYAALLEADPTNIAAMRRQVAVAKGAGQLGAAIAALNRFVRVYSSDEPAWLELSELYCQTQQYELASFAVEELLMLAPENYLHHVRYAELAYTLGAVDTARSYYAQSLELKPHNNLRALHGLNLVLQQTQTATQQLRSWTADQLLAHYNKFAPALLPVVKATINGDAPAPALPSTAAAAATSPSPAAAPAAQREEKAAAATTPAAATAVAAAAAEPTVEVDDVDEPASPQESELPD